MIVIGGGNQLPRGLLNSMYEFRREVFVKRMKWALPMIDGMERDEFDNDATVYFIDRDSNGGITACARLLPTTTRYLLADVFTGRLGRKFPTDPAVWELSRFATDVRTTREGRVLSLSQPTLNLLEAVMKFARRLGVKQLVFGTSIPIERLLLRAGFPVHRLAAPVSIEGRPSVAVFMDIPEEEAAGPIELCRSPDADQQTAAIAC
jgi:acyl homoserine lactone synthase